jgi:hypothetical protein
MGGRRFFVSRDDGARIDDLVEVRSDPLLFSKLATLHSLKKFVRCFYSLALFTQSSSTLINMSRELYHLRFI